MYWNHWTSEDECDCRKCKKILRKINPEIRPRLTFKSRFYFERRNFVAINRGKSYVAQLSYTQLVCDVQLNEVVIRCSRICGRFEHSKKSVAVSNAHEFFCIRRYPSVNGKSLLYFPCKEYRRFSFCAVSLFWHSLLKSLHHLEMPALETLYSVTKLPIVRPSCRWRRTIFSPSSLVVLVTILLYHNRALWP